MKSDLPKGLRVLLEKVGPLVVYKQGLEETFHSTETRAVLVKKIRESNTEEEAREALNTYLSAANATQVWERHGAATLALEEMETALDFLGIPFQPPSAEAQKIRRELEAKMGL
jgi:hypothetical protein